MARPLRRAVRALLRHGASLDSVITSARIVNSPIRCAVGSNALHIAALIGNIGMAKIILEAQVSLSKQRGLRSKSSEVQGGQGVVPLKLSKGSEGALPWPTSSLEAQVGLQAQGGRGKAACA
jgi:hypothetical protein